MTIARLLANAAKDSPLVADKVENEANRRAEHSPNYLSNEYRKFKNSGWKAAMPPFGRTKNKSLGKKVLIASRRWGWQCRTSKADCMSHLFGITHFVYPTENEILVDMNQEKSIFTSQSSLLKDYLSQIRDPLAPTRIECITDNCITLSRRRKLLCALLEGRSLL